MRIEICHHFYHRLIWFEADLLLQWIFISELLYMIQDVSCSYYFLYLKFHIILANRVINGLMIHSTFQQTFPYSLISFFSKNRGQLPKQQVPVSTTSGRRLLLPMKTDGKMGSNTCCHHSASFCFHSSFHPPVHLLVIAAVVAASYAM